MFEREKEIARQNVSRAYDDTPPALGTMLGELMRLRQLEESKRTVKSFSDTPELTATVTRYPLKEPLISVTVINDGPDDIYHEVNDPGDIENTEGQIRAAKLKNGESYTFDAGYPTIRRLYLRAVQTTATVRLKGRVGKPSDLETEEGVNDE